MNAHQARDRAESRARRPRKLAVALMCLSLVTASPAAAAPRGLVLQSESGVGHGVVMPRSAALNFKTVLLRRHESRHHRFDLAAPATFEIRARWSNDSAPGAELEHVSLILDSRKLVGTFVALDSGDTGWGYDWNVFLTSSAPIATVTLAPGRHVLSTSVTQADRQGYESDALLLDPVA